MTLEDRIRKIKMIDQISTVFIYKETSYARQNSREDREAVRRANINWDRKEAEWKAVDH